MRAALCVHAQRHIVYFADLLIEMERGTASADDEAGGFAHRPPPSPVRLLPGLVPPKGKPQGSICIPPPLSPLHEPNGKRPAAAQEPKGKRSKR
jgi:hypothetical protein